MTDRYQELAEKLYESARLDVRNEAITPNKGLMRALAWFDISMIMSYPRGGRRAVEERQLAEARQWIVDMWRNAEISGSMPRLQGAARYTVAGQAYEGRREALHDIACGSLQTPHDVRVAMASSRELRPFWRAYAREARAARRAS